MSTIRVIAGSLKGRKIPFDNRKFNNADITSQKVKEALFSSLEMVIHESVFLDLYGGSGQMSLEALSRGAGEVITAEPDARRFRFIRDLARTLKIEKDWEIFHLRDTKLLKMLGSEGRRIDIIFCDPPYEKEKGPTKLYSGKLQLIEEAGVLNPDGIVIMQHFSFNELEDKVGKFAAVKSHRYGNSALTFYKNVTT